MNILVVEDNVEQAESLELVLQLEGHVVHRALNAAAADSMLAVHRVDAIILDLWMPGEGGESFLFRLRERFETAQTPVVISTAMSHFDLESLSRQSNVRVLQKPYAVRSLLDALAEMVKDGSDDHAPDADSGG